MALLSAKTGYTARTAQRENRTLSRGQSFLNRNSRIFSNRTCRPWACYRELTVLTCIVIKSHQIQPTVNQLSHNSMSIEHAMSSIDMQAQFKLHNASRQ